jgi:gag-polyprotein putative aspartyl protease
MPAYDDRYFSPPAPLALVALRHPGDRTIVVRDVPMLVDSGADVSLIPERSMSALGLMPEPSAAYEVTAFDGRKSIAHVVNLDMLFLRRAFRGRFLVGNQEWGVLGRDILNHVCVLLDGPGLCWEEQGQG